VLVVSEVCAGGYGAGRAREQSARGPERLVGRSAPGAAVGVEEAAQVVFLGSLPLSLPPLLLWLRVVAELSPNAGRNFWMRYTQTVAGDRESAAEPLRRHR